jgi:hypothetical protein
VKQRAIRIAVGILAVWGVSSYGDTQGIGIQPAFPPTLPEPTTYPPITPNPGDERPLRDPFTPYQHGSPAPWQYSDLTPAEQAVADRGLDTTSFEPVHAAFRAASIEQALAAVADSAGTALGVPDLSTIGVVP